MKSGWTIAGLLWGLYIAGAASAHPHVYIDAKAGFAFNPAGQLTALQITWTYDAFTSLTLQDVLNLDQDNDGALDAADLARVVKAQTIWPDDFNGDAYLEKAGAAVALGRPRNGTAAYSDLRISVSFELPLETPLEPGEDVELRLYDPAYYYAYAMVEVESGGPCAASVAAFEADSATSALQRQLARLSREETPDQAGVGRLFADVVRLDCA